MILYAFTGAVSRTRRRLRLTRDRNDNERSDA